MFRAFSRQSSAKRGNGTGAVGGLCPKCAEPGGGNSLSGQNRRSGIGARFRARQRGARTAARKPQSRAATGVPGAGRRDCSFGHALNGHAAHADARGERRSARHTRAAGLRIAAEPDCGGRRMACGMRTPPVHWTGGVRRVAGQGFEPWKAEPADLQSAPFGRSGNLPEVRRPLGRGAGTIIAHARSARESVPRGPLLPHRRGGTRLSSAGHPRATTTTPTNGSVSARGR